MLCGAIYTAVLYVKNKKNKEFQKPILLGLSIVRFLSIFFIALLLLEPLFQNQTNTTEKPIIALLQDNSSSILLNKDSAFYQTEYLNRLEKLKEKLRSKYTVETYTFGSSITENDTIQFNQKETDISSAIQAIKDKYYNRNLGSIILATDGIYNKGSNPFYEAKTLKNVPVYTLALGDTTSKKDVILDQIIHNRLAYKGNNFPVEISVNAIDFKGTRVTVKIEKNGNIVQQKQIVLGDNNSLTTATFELEATAVGLQKYTATVIPTKGEYTYQNNSKDFYIDVLESKQKILILANAPHPDIIAFKRAIEDNKNYETKVVFAKDFKEELTPYSLIIYHNLPSNTNTIKSISIQADNLKIPSLFVLGSQVNYTSFNALNKGLNIPFSSNFSEVQGSVNNTFTLFKYSDNLTSSLNKFPPISVPFSQKYALSNSSEVFIYQKIGLTKTNYPLIVFNKLPSQKIGFILGEGYYRWKYFDYLENNNNEIFNEIVKQSVQYLASKENKSFFKVFSDRNFDENSPVMFEAEVYNKSYELDNSSEVSISIKNEKGNTYPYTFSKIGNRYQLNAGILPPGNYTYTSSTSYNGVVYNQKGEFSITELKVEQNNTVANPAILYNISDFTKGKMFFPNQTNALAEDILNREDLVSIIYSKKEVNDLINLKYIFFFILLLLSTEWFIRKRNGGY